MSKKSTHIFMLITAALLIIGAFFSYALFTHRYAFNSRIAKIIPSTRVEYTVKPLEYNVCFNDLQERQMKAAKSVGLNNPPSSREDIKLLADQLVKVKNCRAFTIARLTDSEPFLKPDALITLKNIGTAFRDSLKAKNLPDYRILVTSLLRTNSQAGTLTEKNSVAVASSCHCYGTTFDISYAQYEPLSLGKSMSGEDLKTVLGEVLRDQRKAGNIYVKHERQQTCFHITSRK